MNLKIPPWLGDPDVVGPCPCGEPPDNAIIIVNGKYLRRWFHEPCLNFLRYELDDNELDDLERWRQQRREQKDP